VAGEERLLDRIKMVIFTMRREIIPETVKKNNLMFFIKLSRQAVPTGLGFATRNYFGA
jgi:hypothetical protein